MEVTKKGIKYLIKHHIIDINKLHLDIDLLKPKYKNDNVCNISLFLINEEYKEQRLKFFSLIKNRKKPIKHPLLSHELFTVHFSFYFY